MVKAAPQNTALVIVDAQNDFCPGGKLAVNDGDKTVPVINSLREAFSTVVLTQDWHPAGHSSFASSHNVPPFSAMEMPYGAQILWPDHCIQGSAGAEFHKDLRRKDSDFLIRKGTNKALDSYSAFFENDHKTRPVFDDGQTLSEKFRQRGIDTLVFTGLAFDYCVGWNALDAVKEGFKAIIVEDATRAIAPDSEQDMRKQLGKAGVKIVKSADLAAAL